MAGGDNAKSMACPICLYQHGNLVKGTRIHDGLETDWYRCEAGHRFGVDWEDEPEPEQPLWPPSEKHLQQAKAVQTLLAEGKTGPEIMQGLLELNLLE